MKLARTSLISVVPFIYVDQVYSVITQLVEATSVLLCEHSSCQLVESDSEADEDNTEYEEGLMAVVSDLLPAFAKSMGSHIAPIFLTLFNSLMKLAKASRSSQDRTMVVATLAEVVQHMGVPIGGYIDALMSMVLKELALSDATKSTECNILCWRVVQKWWYCCFEVCFHMPTLFIYLLLFLRSVPSLWGCIY